MTHLPAIFLATILYAPEDYHLFTHAELKPKQVTKESSRLERFFNEYPIIMSMRGGSNLRKLVQT